MYRNILFTIIVTSTYFANGQDTVHFLPRGQLKTISLSLGYNYNFKDRKTEENKRFHFLELGVWKSNVFRGHHPVSTTMYVATDIGLNTTNFTIGPKIGCFFSLFLFGMGAEALYLTDFKNGSFRFLPSVGFFTHVFKLTISPHILLAEQGNFDINRSYFNFTFCPLKIKERQVK